MKIEYRDRAICIYAPSYLDLTFKKKFENFLDEVEGDGPLILDLSDTELINSHGVSALLKIVNYCNKKDIKLGFAGLSSIMVKQTLNDTGILWLSDNHEYDTVDDAFSSLS